MRFVRASLFASTGLLLFFSGCREAKVQSYRVPKEAPLPPLSFEMPGGMAAANAGAGPNANPTAQPAIPAASAADAALRWTAPESWAPLPPVAMRVAGYRLTRADDSSTAELTITAFPGDVGGDLANINRWRGQIGLNPISADTLATELQRLRIDGPEGQEGERKPRDFKLVEMTNAQSSPAQATLAAYTEHDGHTWFFKLTGAPALISAEKPAFLEFLKTIQPR
ncbi:hypothetical protein AXK12_00945 [Cephaloticoccus capnophilus]|uniref:PsbP C-terminal domain-containing protein n=2 Tax=Cephaloticoccus capnophilus TaxID=1548208 RepID=A0A139STR3_9BACT|nr:hypothetical protein AXK12_00945 [Cephaloticoccus capnophilus]